MNELFGGVVYAGIDTDKHRYPIGKIMLLYILLTMCLLAGYKPKVNFVWFSRAVSNCVPLDGVFVVIFFKIIIYNI